MVKQNAGDEHCTSPTKVDRGFRIAGISIGVLCLAAVTLITACQKSSPNAKARQRTIAYLQCIRMGISTYERDFEKFPPSEPDKLGNTPYGGAALLYYLNGSDGKGYSVTYAGATKVYDARVSNVEIEPGTGQGCGFKDAWGNVIEYFVAYKHRAAWRGVDALGNPTKAWPRTNPGETTADIYPRACNVNLTGIGDYLYESPGLPGPIKGLNIRVPVLRWLDGWKDYTSDWQYHSVPEKGHSFILVSAGPDGKIGTADDIFVFGEE